MPDCTLRRLFAGTAALPLLFCLASPGLGQDRLPWERTQPAVKSERFGGNEDNYRPDDTYRGPAANQGGYNAPRGEAYSPPRSDDNQGFDSRRYRAQGSQVYQGAAANDAYRPPAPSGAYGEPYPPARQPYDRDYGNAGPSQPYEVEPRRHYEPAENGGYYTQNEISAAGHGFFGSVSRGLASAIEYAFQKAGRPNGYILGEDAGGAFVAGLRYGEGRLYTKDAGTHKVFWQGPSIGYDVGAEGSKTMVLVYNLRDPSDIFHRFAGVQGTAYLVGGVGVQFQKYGDVILAPIRSGIGLRLGANVGYLKYTRSPTWNPF